MIAASYCVVGNGVGALIGTEALVQRAYQE